MVGFLIILALTPVLILVLQAITTRFLRLLGLAASGQVVVIVCYVIGYLPVCYLLWKIYLGGLTSTPGSLTVAILYALIVYNLFSYSYFHVFNMSETARRIRILYEIYRAGSLNAEDIPAIYSPKGMLDNRVSRLLTLGQIKRLDGERYALKGRLLYNAARMIAGWGRVLGHPSFRRPGGEGRIER